MDSKKESNIMLEIFDYIDNLDNWDYISFIQFICKKGYLECYRLNEEIIKHYVFNALKNKDKDR